jgi:molybdopterin molybdotransferase
VAPPVTAGGLIEIERAREVVLERAAPLEAERVALAEALARVLADEVRSEEPVPGFDNSAMDGFAVRAGDTAGARPDAPVVLRVAGESRAGHPADTPLREGEAIRISTGAVVPAGADAVVRVEDTRSEDGTVLVEAEVEAGRDIRRAGEDIAPGQTVLRPGTPIGPAELGVIASLGLRSVACRRHPRVRVITGGDELIEPGEEMRPGAVRNSNAYSVSALVEWSGAAVAGAALIPDRLEETRTAIAAALDADVVVICGGVSVGEHDHVKRALAELEVEESFWGLALKPGKPTWFGSRGRTLVFGLPGNPVSAMVTFLLLVRPALAALSGRDPERQRTTARLTTDYEKRPGRAHAVRCRLELDEDGWRATPAGAQGSHILTSMLGADCLALIPTEAGSLSAGDPVQVEILRRD